MEQHRYAVSLKWEGDRKGILKLKGRPEIVVATPPDFGGPEGYWSPEELFVASILSCLMTTFLYFVFKNDLKLISYESEGNGILGKVGEKMKFKEIYVNIRVQREKGEDIKKVETFLKLAEKYCLISNSSDVDIKLNFQVE